MILPYLYLSGSKSSRLAWVRMVIMGLLLTAPGGCGIKAPPVALQVKTPTIQKLVHALSDGALTLSWDLADDSPEVQRYTLYQSKVPASEEACQGCPLSFERLLSMPASMQRNGTQTLKLEKGFRYGFKVTATTENGAEGPDSNLIELNYE